MASQDTLGSIAIACAAATAIAQLVDWLLPRSAVQTLRDWLERLWLWLAEQRSGRLVHLLFAPRVFARLAIILALVLAAVSLAVFVSIGPKPGYNVNRPEMPSTANPYAAIMWLTIAPLALGSAGSLAALATTHFRWIPRFTAWITATRRAHTAIVRLMLVTALGALFVVIPVLVSLLLDFPYGLVTLLLGLFLAPATLFLSLTSINLFWLLLMSFFTFIVRAAEFFVLRLAEHPKGPVLGLSAALAALGALLKALS